jgi:hypothetical protein
MQIPFVNPLTSALLFVQALLLYLRFDEAHDVEGSHWGLIMIPTFVAEFFLVAMLASEALFEGSDKKKKDATASEVSETSLSYVLLEMVVAVLILLTTALYVFYLDDDTDLPLYWITTTFFGSTILFFATTISMCKTTLDRAKLKGGKYLTEPYETVHQRGIRTVIVGFLVMVQGLFLWLYNSPWGRVMDTSLFWILLPAIIIVVSSFVISIRQTYFRRNNPGPNLVRQGAFILLILLLFICLILLILHLDYDLIGNPKWIVLPILIYSGLLIFISLYIYYHLKSLEKAAKSILPATNGYSPVSQSTLGETYYANVHYVDGRTEQFCNIPMQGMRIVPDPDPEVPQSGIVPSQFDPTFYRHPSYTTY